jgi:hypothetical protein
MKNKRESLIRAHYHLSNDANEKSNGASMQTLWLVKVPVNHVKVKVKGDKKGDMCHHYKDDM